MRVTRLVHIPYDLSEDFESFLYNGLDYEDFGFSRHTSGNDQIYSLILDDRESTLILLRYEGSSIKIFGRKNV